jgi:hypothetical protein
MLDLQIPQQIWIEMYDEARDACDVMVKMEDGNIYTAVFVTLPYLRRQMSLTLSMCSQIPDAQPVCFAALETPHIILETLEREIIEDTIDNLLTMENFGTMFTRVTEEAPADPKAPPQKTDIRSTKEIERATQEVAAVVIADVLMIES